MAYPDNVYPADPDFPALTTSTRFGIDFWNVSTSYITDITAAMSLISENDGHLKLGAGKTISWTGGSDTMSESGGSLVVPEVEVTSTLTLTSLTAGDDCTVAGNVSAATGGSTTVSGNLVANGDPYDRTDVTVTTQTLDQVGEPDDPTDNDECKMWSDNGVSNDVGDLMVKLKHGGSTKEKVLVDFSAI